MYRSFWPYWYTFCLKILPKSHYLAWLRRLQRLKFLKIGILYCIDTIWIKNFDKISLSRMVRDGINFALWHFYIKNSYSPWHLSALYWPICFWAGAQVAAITHDLRGTKISVLRAPPWRWYSHRGKHLCEPYIFLWRKWAIFTWRKIPPWIKYLRDTMAMERILINFYRS